MALLILGIVPFFPESFGLGRMENRTLGVLVAFLILLVTEALPIIMTSLSMCVIMYLLHVVDDLKMAFEGFSEPVVYFVMASFGITTALTVVPISQRILKKLLKMFGKNIESVLFAVMIACGGFSSIVSNIPTCAIFMTISMKFLEVYKSKEDRKKMGKIFMIAVPVSSMIGGMMTPSGSSINILAISQLEKITGIRITFIQWMLVSMPIAIIMIPLAWLIFIKIYHPVKIREADIAKFIEEMDIPQKIEKKERKILFIVSGMLFLWVLSSWIREINIIAVTIIGCGMLFFPGIEVLDIKIFIKENSWDAFFLVGALSSICNMMIKNGLSTTVAKLIPQYHAPTIIMVGVCAVLVFGMLLVIPVATALIPVMCPTIILLAQQAGISPITVVMTAALCACNCYLIPLDTVPLLTYSKGYYSMTDMIKSTWILQIAMIVLCTIWIPVVTVF